MYHKTVILLTDQPVLTQIQLPHPEIIGSLGPASQKASPKILVPPPQILNKLEIRIKLPGPLVEIMIYQGPVTWWRHPLFPVATPQKMTNDLSSRPMG